MHGCHDAVASKCTSVHDSGRAPRRHPNDTRNRIAMGVVPTRSTRRTASPAITRSHDPINVIFISSLCCSPRLPMNACNGAQHAYVARIRLEFERHHGRKRVNQLPVGADRRSHS